MAYRRKRMNRGNKRKYRRKNMFKGKKRYTLSKFRYPGFKNAPVWKSSLAPRVFKIKMRYHLITTMTNAQEQYYVMRGNSIYDPDATSGGSQPPLFDDFAGMYVEYCVLSSKCAVTARNKSSTGVARVVLQASLDAAPVSPLSDDPYVQQDTTVKVLGLATGGKDAATLKMYRSTSQLFGRPIQYDPNFSAAFTTNPNSQWYWIITGYDNTVTTPNLDLELDINITYYCALRKVKSSVSYD